MNEVNNLLVPVELSAMVVNEQVRKFENFRRFGYNFQNLATFTSPEPQPFGGGVTDFSKHDYYQGIYLHWKLPAALRHGTQQADGDIKFPLVPNRWLVIRYSGALEKRVATAWVVESDFLGNAGGTSPFLDYRIPYNPDTPVAGQTLIGRSVALNTPNQWKETNDKALFLTAIGPGDATFSGYEPIAENVFSFHDTLDNIITDNISYLVCGWYSDSSQDILQDWKTPDDFTKLLASLNWQVANKVEASSKQSLYHGMVFGIPWNLSGPSPTPAHNASGIFVTIGNTAADALTALITKLQQDHPKGGPINPRIIEAFQYSLLHYLEERNGVERLEQRIHEAWFGSVPGGVIWEIIDNSTDDDATLTPDYFKQEAKILAQLNANQQAYEQALFAVRRMQAELFAAWWKYYRAKNMYFPPPSVPDPTEIFKLIDSTNAGSLYNQVAQQLVVVQAAYGKLPQITATDGPGIAQQIASFARNNGISDLRQLKRGEARRFWQATDPVILINGANYHPPVLTNETLPIRTADQLVTAIQYDQSTKIDIYMLQAAVPTLNLTNLPAGIQGLINEFFLLDSTNATAIVKVVWGNSDAAIISKLTGIMKSHTQINGIPPAFIPGDWSQPWEPIFMEWKVAWYPIPFNQVNYLWQFDGNDYEWTGNGKITTTPYMISGRTFLTPQITYSFRSRLEQFLQDFPQADLTALKNFIGDVAHWDFISQTLTGFSTQLKKVDPLSNVTPVGPISKLIQDAYSSVPAPSSVIPFDGVRCGQFVIKQLKLYDRFGQALEIVEDQESTGPTSSDNFRPIISEGLVPVHFVEQKNTFRFVQLLPRLLQPARLNFNFLDAKNDALTIDTAAGANPVCAWLLPNHIDQALMAYTPEGIALGELRVTVNVDNVEELNFWSSPHSPAGTIDDLVTSWPHLGYMFQSLKVQGPAVFTDFMTIIDSTLWTTDPLGGRHDEYFSVLIGRPLALVRSSLDFELYGGPLRDPSWEKTFDTSAPPFVKDNFPIKLGNQALSNDGLIGYYLGQGKDAYKGFYYAQEPGGNNSPDITDGYIQPINKSNFIQLDLTGNSKAYLSMLIDPRAAVHAVTGILPITTLGLPDHFLADAMGVMEMTFRAGPVLTEVAAAGQQTMQGAAVTAGINYPPPAASRHGWSWIEQDANGKDWNTYAIAGGDQSARLSTVASSLRDGWMVLKPADNSSEQ